MCETDNTGGPLSNQIRGLQLWQKNEENCKYFDVLMVKIGKERLEFMAPRNYAIGVAVPSQFFFVLLTPQEKACEP